MDRRNLTLDDVEMLRRFFLEAMMRGWAFRASKITIPELPGAKAIPYEDKKRKLYLLDWYFAPPNSQNNGSVGTTMIWYQGVPVWVMHYGGQYKKEAIPVLRAALRRAYENGVFCGGRGQFCFYTGKLAYINQVEGSSSFANFKGKEMIIDPSFGCILGWHDYWGTLL